MFVVWPGIVGFDLCWMAVPFHLCCCVVLWHTWHVVPASSLPALESVGTKAQQQGCGCKHVVFCCAFRAFIPVASCFAAGLYT